MGTAVDTRDRLIAAAEELFAANGIEAVSLREIVRASGARNTTALQYHFGDRAGLVRAVLEKHHLDIDIRRHAMLDAYEAEGEPDLWALAHALVGPLAAELADPDGGGAYLQILAELMNRRRPALDPAAFDDPEDSMFRWREMVAPLLSEEALRLHRRFVALRFAVVELARRADTAPHTDDRLFVSHLVDLVAALLSAPPSAQTLRLAGARDAARGRSRSDLEPSVPPAGTHM
ncbi:MAG TPA: helix-turn-helix domain-containing protein [Solirubrobacteraceae bacterium]|nr:helix-turn-helix domain-containing protein [Solirubrobacteraceae bacterium]